MSGNKKKNKQEGIGAFLQRVTQTKTNKNAREQIQKMLQLSAGQQVALQRMGIISVIVVPGGVFHYTISPALLKDRVGINSIERALTSVLNALGDIRNDVIEQEVKQRVEKINKQEDSNGKD